MKKVGRLLAIMALGLMICNCSCQGSTAGDDRDRALKFLQGIQNGDKQNMYAATNLTSDMVNASRDKLVNAAKQLTDQQRSEMQHALRISGEIDFFLAKTRPMFPKSASFQIIKTTAKSSTDGVRNSVHRVKITYANQAEAMRDKTGKPVKEMIIELQQATRSVDGRPVHELSFAAKDFEKIADRDFEVLSYF
jgi:hypothetical protein